MNKALVYFVNAEGYIIVSKEAYELANKNTYGNGCGAGRLSRVLALIMQLFYGIDLRVPCRFHDLEYTAGYKNEFDKIVKDAAFQINIIHAAGNKRGAKTLAKWFHAAVLLHGDKAYYEGR